MNRTRVRLFAITAAVAIAAGLGMNSPAPARADTIDKSMLEESPEVMKYLKGHHYKTVGVLKFVVKKGDRSANLDAGTLNAMMATRLEQR